MSRITNNLSAGDTGRISQINNLRTEAKASSYLFAFANDPADLKVNISPAQVYFGSSLVEYAGGESPEFTAPSTNPRIDIISIKDDGTITRTAGTESASPTAPDVPPGEVPIAQVFNRVGQTEINDEDDSSNGYIQKDLRPFLSIGDYDAQEFTENGTWIKPFNKTMALVEMWGAGGSGASRESGTSPRLASGGAGGAYTSFLIPLSLVDLNEAVVVGEGGEGVSGNNNGNPGGESSVFGVTAGGGQGGRQTAGSETSNLLALGGEITGDIKEKVRPKVEDGGNGATAGADSQDAEDTESAGTGGGASRSNYWVGNVGSAGTSKLGRAGNGGGAVTGGGTSGAGQDGFIKITSF